MLALCLWDLHLKHGYALGYYTFDVLTERDRI